MLITSRLGVLGCAMWVAAGCAQVDRSLGGDALHVNDDGGTDAGPSGSGGEAADGGRTGSGGAPSGSGGSPTGTGGVTASGGGPSGTGGVTASGGGPTGTGGSGSYNECAIDCAPGDHKTLSWGPDGGEAAYRDSSRYEPCSTRYLRMRKSEGVQVPEFTCYSFMPICYPELSPVNFSQVFSALESPDVKAALASSGSIFGVDPRPYDGSLLFIRYGDAVIYVGQPCTTDAGCNPVPHDVGVLAKILQDLDEQEAPRLQCEDGGAPPSP